MRGLVRIRSVNGCEFARHQRYDAVQFARDRSNICG